MTKAQDALAKEAAKAAQLIKQTAEQTATALNIQYIQRDISDMKIAITKLAENQDGKIKDIQCQTEDLAKTVNIGIGIAIAFSFIIPLLIKFAFK